MNYYAYEVKWTKPMEGFTYPIITASVYFFVNINKILEKSSAATVDVRSQSYIHNTIIKYFSNCNFILNFFFTISLKIKYVFEGNRFVHDASNTQFNPAWLYNVYENKRCAVEPFITSKQPYKLH